MPAIRSPKASVYLFIFILSQPYFKFCVTFRKDFHATEICTAKASSVTQGQIVGQGKVGTSEKNVGEQKSAVDFSLPTFFFARSDSF